MKSIYSIVRYVNNQFSNENIAIGLIVISRKQIFYKFSPEKINFISKLNPNISKLVDFSLNKLESTIGLDIKNESVIFKFKNVFSEEYLNRLSNYNNGILQFDPPSSLEVEYTQESFDAFFNKFINPEPAPKKVQKLESKLRSYIKSAFYAPLQDQINVDFKLKQKQIPSLFFDFKFDGLGVNGSLYTAKAIDLNSGDSVQKIGSDISEFEAVNVRLDNFVKDNGIEGISKHFLIVDPYEGNKQSYQDLYSIVSGTNVGRYEIIGSDELGKVVAEMKSKNVHKFTERFKLSPTQ